MDPLARFVAAVRCGVRRGLQAFHLLRPVAVRQVQGAFLSAGSQDDCKNEGREAPDDVPGNHARIIARLHGRLALPYAP